MWRNIVVIKAKQVSLVVCLFLFLFVVVGGGLHLNPGGAFLAALTGTPLVIHLLNRTRPAKDLEHNSSRSQPNPYIPRCDIETDVSHPSALERDALVRQ
jgi:hypothetical protein